MNVRHLRPEAIHRDIADKLRRIADEIEWCEYLKFEALSMHEVQDENGRRWKRVLVDVQIPVPNESDPREGA